MDRQISAPEQTLDRAYVIDAAAAWTDGLRMENGLPVNPLHYVETTARIAALYGLDYKTALGRQIVDTKVRQLSCLQVEVRTPQQYEQLTVDTSESEPYAHVPADVQQVAAEIVALTVDQAYERQDHELVSGRRVGYLHDRVGRLRQRVAHLIDERRRLRHEVSHDALTDALNIRGQEDIERRWLSRQSTTPRVILPLDATCFKEPNDVLGHAIGDQLLIEMVHELRSYTRGSDKVHIVRTGGDEFMMMIDSTQEGFRFGPLLKRIQAVQLEKVANGKNVAIWNRIRHMQRKGPLDVSIIERAEGNDADETEKRRYLYIRGTEICDLRDLAVLSVGGDSAPVANEDDLLNMKMRAEQVLTAHKAELHTHMGGPYRTRRHAGFIMRTLHLVSKAFRQ